LPRRAGLSLHFTLGKSEFPGYSSGGVRGLSNDWCITISLIFLGPIKNQLKLWPWQGGVRPLKCLYFLSNDFLMTLWILMVVTNLLKACSFL